MSFRTLFLVALVVLLAGCTTIKGWFGDDKAKAVEPAELTDIASPIATGAEIYAASYGGQTMALAPNGRPLWSRDVGSYGGLALAGDRLILSDRDGTVWALDRTTGNALWKQDVLARRWLTTPAVQGGYAVVGDVEGYLHWIRLEDGTLAGRDRVENA